MIETVPGDIATPCRRRHCERGLPGYGGRDITIERARRAETPRSREAEGEIAVCGADLTGEMMKRYVLALLGVVILMGCGGEKPILGGRLHQPAGAFSYVTPDGWSQTKLFGIDFIIVSGEAEFGLKPNLFVDFVKSSSTVTNAAQEVIETYQSGQRAYEVAQESTFATDSGLQGIKITASRETKDALPLASFHYLFQDAARVIVVTATCAEPVAQKYERIFDTAMKSLEAEGASQLDS
jgi:hypothetical protein